MAFRILLFFALIGAVLLGGAYYHAAKNASVLRKDLAASQTLLDKKADALALAEADKRRLQDQLSVMDVDLGATKTRLTATEAAKVQLGRELRDARATLAERESQLTALTGEKRALIARLDEANSRQTSPAAVAEYQSRIQGLEEALAAAQSAPPPTQISTAPAPSEGNGGLLLTTNRARSTSVVSVGPANAFVVINYGAVHGALPTQTIRIQRGTETLATALISDVREKYSIAQVQPESLRGALHKGDTAVIAK